MAPGTVRTIPPWVIQRPPQAVPPQHNHAPADRRRNVSDSSRDDRPYDDDVDGDGDGDTYHGSGGGNTASGTTAHDSPVTSDGLATAADGAKEPSAPIIQKDESAGSGIRHRLSHLFLRKEGRRWDHLRSAEPVIVPQYHVVTRPAGYDEERGGQRDSAYYGPDIRVSSPSSSSPPPPPPPPDQNHPWWYNPETQWRGFIESTRYPRMPHEKSEILNDEEMARLQPDFGYNGVLRPKVGGGDGGGGGLFRLGHHHNHHGYADDKDKDRDEIFYRRIWHVLLHHPFGPLACRLTVLMTSIVALVLAATIYRRERLSSLDALDVLGQGSSSSSVSSSVSGSGGSGGQADGDVDRVWLADRRQERTQVIVAIVVDVVAVPYIGYITVDDYTGKPLGLRRPQERIRLLLTDLFFIIFKSASTALGFEAMIFFTTEDSEGLVRALGAFELIGLIAWVLTLTINIFREIERLVGK